VTVTCRVVLAALPQPSVTMRVTVQVPAAGKVWDMAELVLVGVPSPKFHR
jgi:hypothetical protein